MVDPRLYQLLDKVVTEAHQPQLLDVIVKEQMIVDLSAQLNEQLNEVVLAQLSEPDQLVYNLMLDEPIPKTEVESFLQEHIPNVQQQLVDKITQFTERYITMIQQELKQLSV